MGLWEDAKNIRDKDPAARNVAEVIILYPGFHVLVTHKIAHFLYRHRCFFSGPPCQPAGAASDR